MNNYLARPSDATNEQPSLYVQRVYEHSSAKLSVATSEFMALALFGLALSPSSMELAPSGLDLAPSG